MFNFNSLSLTNLLPPQFNVNSIQPMQNLSISTNITISPQIPHMTPTLFMPQVCQMIKTPDTKIFSNAPYMYDVSSPINQPTSLVTLKTMHNNISNDIFDGTIAIRNPIEPISQNATLKILEKSIETYCYKPNNK